MYDTSTTDANDDANASPTRRDTTEAADRNGEEDFKDAGMYARTSRWIHAFPPLSGGLCH